MKGIIIQEENELKISVHTPEYGTIIIRPDNESCGLIAANNVTDMVDGFVQQKTSTSPEGINFNEWVFHIESFETD